MADSEYRERRERYFSKKLYDPEDEVSFTAGNDFLPMGIERTENGALVSERLLPLCAASEIDSRMSGSPVRVAVFDFDGTCIDTSSPRKLVNELWPRHIIHLYKAIRLGLWGIAYKLNLNRNEEQARIRVFSAFKDKDASFINRYLADFFMKKIEPTFRMDAEAQMLAHLEEGHVVIVSSATFEPIIAMAMSLHPIQFAFSTRMHIDDDGNYTDVIEDLSSNGSDKVTMLEGFLNDMFTEQGWELAFAYGDHFSDIPMLELAQNPCVVTPDRKLRRYAEEKDWQIVDWH